MQACMSVHTGVRIYAHARVHVRIARCRFPSHRLLAILHVWGTRALQRLARHSQAQYHTSVIWMSVLTCMRACVQQCEFGRVDLMLCARQCDEACRGLVCVCAGVFALMYL